LYPKNKAHGHANMVCVISDAFEILVGSAIAFGLASFTSSQTYPKSAATTKTVISELGKYLYLGFLTV